MLKHDCPTTVATEKQNILHIRIVWLQL